MNSICFKSKLSKKYYDVLEKIFYINRNQKKIIREIDEAVEKYDEHKIEMKNKNISFSLTKLNSCQTLFTLNENSDHDNLLRVLIW
jgi:hypothetical protein